MVYLPRCACATAAQETPTLALAWFDVEERQLRIEGHSAGFLLR